MMIRRVALGVALIAICACSKKPDNTESALDITSPAPSGSRQYEMPSGMPPEEHLNPKLLDRPQQSDAVIIMKKTDGVKGMAGEIDDALKAIRAADPRMINFHSRSSTELGSGGVTTDITLVPKGKAWRFTFYEGWGDCPAGCMNSHTYFYTYTRNSRRVIKNGESGAESPPGI